MYEHLRTQQLIKVIKRYYNHVGELMIECVDEDKNHFTLTSHELNKNYKSW